MGRRSYSLAGKPVAAAGGDCLEQLGQSGSESEAIAYCARAKSGRYCVAARYFDCTQPV
jgi:hypothetical protein